LPDKTLAQATVPVERLFELLQAENAAVRALWTQEIVGQGKKIGLKFDEHWRDADSEAGPLPALFLREIARSMEKGPIRVSLFLGSDYPISPDNRFEGLQKEKFQVLRQTRQPQYFYLPDIERHTAMFADVASVEPCVECHNRHEQSPKHDWRLHDIMGAATWMYPAASVSTEEILQALTALHKGFDDAYRAYLEKAKTFKKPPAIGDKWPSEGYFLPDAEVFMQAALARTAPHTLPALAALAAAKETGTGEGKPHGDAH
jgi:adenylate cyclase